MQFSKEVRNLIEHISYDKPPQEVCRIRTEYCLNWYSRKAVFYKNFFFTLSIISIAAPLVSTYIITQNQDSFIGAILTGLATFSSSLLALYNVSDKWSTYRTAAEYIKSEYSLYCVHANPYHTSEAHILYLQNIEKYMTQIHVHWLNIQHASTQTKDNDTPVS